MDDAETNHFCQKEHDIIVMKALSEFFLPYKIKQYANTVFPSIQS
jgi:hypothetical protein